MNNQPSEPESKVLKAIRERKEEKARALGLVARWAPYGSAKGYVSIHDPTTGEWHDLPFKQAPGWAKWETTKRSEIYEKTGDYGAFDLDAAQMHKVWEKENPPASPEEEGIVEEYELPED